MTPRTRTRITVVAVLAAGLGVLPLLPAALAAIEPVAEPDLGRFDVLEAFQLDQDEARVTPEEFTAVAVDVAGLGRDLAQAPAESNAVVSTAAATVTLPDPAGRPVEFALHEVPVMEAALAAQHPEIRTYAGTQVDDPRNSIAADLTPNGFHAAVRSLGNASWYVDPAYNGRGVTEHLSYFADALPVEQRLDEEGPLVRDAERRATRDANRAGESPGAEVVRRTYRVALVTDPAYAAYFASSDVLAEKATLMNRVNQIYNSDLAVRMVMADGSDELNLDTAAAATGANGPCGASACYTTELLSSCSSDLLDRNTFVIGQLIGADSYDIGHIALGGGGGGIAGLGVVGEDRKAEGCTGLDTPDGDFFAIDFVAHEMGHQFNGEHTFNGANGSCAPPNRWGPSAVEPGSGSSVMAYAGICFSDDLQPHTDPYFSQQSIDEVTEHVTGATTSYAEVQTVTLRGFDAAGDSFTVTYPGTGLTAAFARGTTYTQAFVLSEMQRITGAAVSVSGYDGATSPGDAGFTVTWPNAATDADRLTMAGVTGGVTGFVGNQVQGGPSTNQGVADPSGNHAPEVTAPADKTIPLRTPFVLAGSGTDADADALTYLWEQNDPGLAITGLEPGDPLILPDRVVGPLFRVFGDDAAVTPEAAVEYESDGQNLADGSPARSFPDMAQVLADNTNAETGVCTPMPADPTSQIPDAYLDCQSEFLPTAAYQLTSGELNFRLTARDNVPAGGGTSFDDVTLDIGTAGPFLVTSRATAGTPAAGGSSENVVWDVAGTSSATYATHVRITLSTDGGLTFPTVLAESTPNDGVQSVTWPDTATTQARIKVEAVGNYFFDVNDASFTITSSSGPTPTEPTPTEPTPTEPTPTGPTPTDQVNTPPDARATATPRVVLAGERIALSAAGTSDAQTAAGALTYEWDFGNQGREVDATGPTATASFGRRGFRTVTLTVTDPDGLRDTVKVPVRVLVRTDCEAGIVYRTPGWSTRAAGDALGGRYCRAVAGDQEQRMRLAFSGGKLRIDYATARSGGRALVFVDDVRVGALRFGGSSRAPAFGRTATFTGFGRGNHSVRIVVVRGTAFVDTFSY